MTNYSAPNSVLSKTAEFVVQVEEHDPDELFTIPDNIKYMVLDGCSYDGEFISYGDLSNVSSCMITVDKDSYCSYLNYMSGLDSISFIELDNGCKITGVDGTRLPDGLSLTFNYLY